MCFMYEGPNNRQHILSTKNGGLIREISSLCKPTFYPCSFVHSQRMHSAAAGPLTTALYTTERSISEIKPML